MKGIFILIIGLSFLPYSNCLCLNSRKNTKLDDSEILTGIERNQFLCNNRTVYIDSNKLSKGVRLNTFTNIPKEIAGCVFYFYLSEKDKKKGNFIMVENFADPGFLCINGKMERFNLLNFKDISYFLYTNGTYKLKIEFKSRTASYNESFTMKGMLTLSKNGVTLIKEAIIGEYGC